MTSEQAPIPERLLEHKIALVTGGASGIGKAIVEEFLKEGASVAIFDIQDAQSVVEELSPLGKVAFYKVDVSSEQETSDGFKKAEADFGTIDVLVNNAGIDPKGHDLSSHPIDVWQKVLNINLNGSFYLTRLVGARLLEQNKPGSIIFITTVHTYQAFPNEAAYDASKLGMVGLMRSVALDWGKYNIRLNAIAPGAIYPTGINNEKPSKETEGIVPLQRFGRPDEIATVAAFLASDKASYVHGAEFRVDGGLSVKTPLS